MREGLRLFWNDLFIKRSILLFFLLFVLFIAIFILKFRDLPPQLPLFYSLPRGNEQLGNPIFLAILPLSALVIELVNIVISAYVYKKEALLSKILIVMGSFISLILFITFIKIILAIS